MPENTEQVDSTQATAGKTFTQAELDAIVGERLGRLKAKYADYDEAKAALAELNELKEASKTELQKAVEERDRYKAELDKLKADRERADLVAKLAAEQGVDADLLSRMDGDVEENAKFLKERQEGAPKHGAVPDYGEANANAGKKSTSQQFAEAIDLF